MVPQGRSLPDGKSLELDCAMMPEVIGPTEQLFGTGSMIESASGGSYVGGYGPVEVEPLVLMRF